MGKKLYDSDVEMSVIGRTQRTIRLGDNERVEEHVIFRIKTINSGQATQKHSIGSVSSLDNQALSSWTLRLNLSDFQSILPYHFIMDKECRLVQIGSALA